MELTCRRRFQVASYHVGANAWARPSALMGFLEEAAGAHAAEAGLSVPDLLPRGLTWVLSRYHLRLLRPLHMGDEVEVVTWPSGRSGIFATRDFEVLGDGGDPVALATTSWVILDLASKRPRPIDAVVPPGWVIERHVFPHRFAAIPAPAGADTQVTLPVMLRDLDMNLHVNHIVYLQWALEAVPLPLLQAGLPTDVEIAYQAEARHGDRVVSAAQEAPSSDGARILLHRISHAGSGADLARLRTTWRA